MGSKTGGNQYSEKWTFEEAEKVMIRSVELSKSKKYDFIGEVAKELGIYRDLYDYILEKFPELKAYWRELRNNCEANCFANGKNGTIVPSLAIMNLKSNHGWTDRAEVKEVKQDNIDLSNLTIEEIEQLANIQAKMNGKSS